MQYVNDIYFYFLLLIFSYLLSRFSRAQMGFNLRVSCFLNKKLDALADRLVAQAWDRRGIVYSDIYELCKFNDTQHA